MAQRDLVVLPVAVLPRPGECSRSLLLRTAAANGLGMSALERLLGMKIHTLSGDQPSQLASMLGVSSAWFCEHLVTEVHGGTPRRWRVLGQDWTAASCLRGHRPQVCPECLAATQYCQTVWNVAGYVACLVHGCPLEAQCAHCMKPIGWGRPAINVCKCGWMLGRSDAQPVSRSICAWVRWVASQTDTRRLAAPQDQAGDDQLPRWVQGLTVDGAFQTLMALGIRKERFRRISAADAVQVRTPSQISAILERGIALGWSLDSPSTKALQMLDGWVYEEGLGRLALRAINDGDRVFAKTLVSALKRANYRCQATGRKPMAVQTDLFEGFDA